MADPITVEGPDGVLIEFPAGTPDSVIAKVMAETYPPQREGMDLVSQIGGVATRALAPYATAAGLGAAAGAPFAGVGAVPGAAGGVLSLGVGDIGTGIYNLAAPLFGGERVPLP